jgi:hypothetical protein
MHTTPAGVPFVTLQFNQDTPARVRQNVVGEETTELAVVIDDEIVAIVRYDAQRFTQRFELTCPPHLQTTEARRAWVQQVVGRLAVPMPITLAEL